MVEVLVCEEECLYFIGIYFVFADYFLEFPHPYSMVYHQGMVVLGEDVAVSTTS